MEKSYVVVYEIDGVKYVKANEIELSNEQSIKLYLYDIDGVMYLKLNELMEVVSVQLGAQTAIFKIKK